MFQGSGSLKVDLQVGDLSFDQITYTLTSESYQRTGVLDVAGRSALSTVIGGIPEGDGYTLALSAGSRDGGATCSGASTPFAVGAQRTTVIALELVCQRPRTNGSVLINASLDECPQIDAIQALPGLAVVGAAIALTATAHDSDAAPSPLKYRWMSAGGALSGADSKEATFTCTSPGAAELTLTVDDGSCQDVASFELTCLSNGCEPACPADGTCGMAPDGCGGTIDCGPCTPIVLAYEDEPPNGIAVDGTNVYWTTVDSVRTVPAAGGTPSTLVSGLFNASAIAVDGNSVYFTTNSPVRGTVMKVSKAGGSPITLASGQASPSGLAVDGVNVYWATFDGQTIMQVPADGGTAITLASGGAGFPSEVAVSGGYVYWTDQLDVSRAIVGSGGATILTADVGSALAVDASSVYFVTFAGTIMKMPSAGGVTTTLATFQPSAMYENYRMAVDGAFVYWTADFGGTVQKVPLAGGAIITLASGQGTPRTIASDGDNLYWTNFADSTIVKLKK
jgi:hypothetical protein